jgi:hypothetical protein
MAMVTGGNLLTHYNYRRCFAAIDSSTERLSIAVRTPDHSGDVDLDADLTGPSVLFEHSPFESIREARRFAGPLPFTFDYEPETHSIVAIKATRHHWQPAPVAVTVRQMSFFNQLPFRGCTPILAAAFHVKGIDYRWERGQLHPLGGALETRRTPFHGVRQIIAFNWPYYAAGSAAVIAGAVLAVWTSTLPVAWLLRLAVVLAGSAMVASRGATTPRRSGEGTDSIRSSITDSRPCGSTYQRPSAPRCG